jgi:hypothetical protein
MKLYILVFLIYFYKSRYKIILQSLEFLKWVCIKYLSIPPLNKPIRTWSSAVPWDEKTKTFSFRSYTYATEWTINEKFYTISTIGFI